MQKSLTSIVVLCSLLLAPLGVQSAGEGVFSGSIQKLNQLKDTVIQRVLEPQESSHDTIDNAESADPLTQDDPILVIDPPLHENFTETATESDESLVLDLPVVDSEFLEREEELEDVLSDTEEEDAQASLSTVQEPSEETASLASIGDPVLHWNAIALQAVADDHSGIYGPPEQGGPTPTSRALAIVHAAIFDAVNSIDRTHEPYRVFAPVRHTTSASIDAAVAEAAHRTLSALYPSQRGIFDSARKLHLREIGKGPTKILGMTIGRLVAQQILLERRHDGSDSAIAHASNDAPGRHRTDPMNPDQGYLTPKWGTVDPFVMDSALDFRSPPPPDITSEEYATAYNEVKEIGGDGTTTPTGRTEEQSKIGTFWGYDGTNKLGTPPRLYNQIARVIAEQQGNTVSENARLFALINLAQADAGIAAWETKYVYDYWRPIVAIREAEPGTGPTGLGDANPLTEGDPSWTPMGAQASNQSNGENNFTPPFPAYPSGHASFGAAAFRSIERFYETDEIPFTFLSDELNGITTDHHGSIRPYSPRSFSRLSDATKENAQSRIYLGIHWNFDAAAGIDMGNAIADYVFDSVLRPLE